MKVGFIGLGNMGNPMAANVLKAGHSLTVYDLRREAGRNLEEAGAKWAASPKDVAAQSIDSESDSTLTWLKKQSGVRPRACNSS